MIICSYFTPAYRDKADKLKASCERFGYQHRIIELPEAKSWIDGIHKKCQIILNVLLDVRQTVIWIDADAEILKPIPDETWLDCDWAAYNWHGDPQNTLGIYFDEARVLHSGGVTVWAYSAPAIELLLRWHRALLANPEGVDDQVLDAVLNLVSIPLRRKNLPKELNWMVGHFKEPHDGVVVRHDYVCK